MTSLSTVPEDSISSIQTPSDTTLDTPSVQYPRRNLRRSSLDASCDSRRSGVDSESPLSPRPSRPTSFLPSMRSADLGYDGNGSMESIIASEYYAPSRQSQFVAGEYYGPRIRTGDYLDVVDMRGTVTVASSLSEDLDDGKTRWYRRRWVMIGFMVAIILIIAIATGCTPAFS